MLCDSISVVVCETMPFLTTIHRKIVIGDAATHEQQAKRPDSTYVE
jgi:hypothetical protein